MAWRPHRDDERHAVDANLERLHDSYLVTLPVAEHRSDHAGGERVRALELTRRQVGWIWV